ncbi:MAG: hypothetical protein LBU44_02615 [Mediterranea sp.]|jgi:hypothetical protein|nr:hypothetical protein [Mediterranea sp.]
MKEEIGKWLMDIAKYMVTALLLSSVFRDMEKPWLLTSVTLSAIVIFMAGLWLIGNKKGKEV